MGSQWRPRGPDDLDDEQRSRIRRQVLGGVRPLRRTLAQRVEDRAYDVLSALAAPAPLIVRAIVTAAVVVSLVGSATVASADALPQEPLYTVKLASEQVRLALARTPEDRASVQLSMAEHRLAEAVRLIGEGRDAEAVGVTSAYGTHLATAAAELAAVERLSVATRPVIEQLRRRLAEQQHQAADMAARSAEDPATPVGAQLLRAIASVAPAPPSGATVSEAIAEHAASVTGQLAAVAERLAQAAAGADQQEEGAGAEEPRPAPLPAAAAPAAAARQEPRPGEASARARATATATARPAAATARPTATPKGTEKPSADPKKAEAAKAAAEKAKHEAEKARAAAEKAKDAAKRTPTPRPAQRR